MTGIFNRTPAAAKEVLAVEEMSTVDMVVSDEAYDDAVAIGQEAEVDAAAISQAMSVSDRVVAQEAMVAEMLAKPELITAGTVALARESMDLAMVALGAESAGSDFRVSIESMESAPVEAMEVTHEGVKDVAKKIYEGIKMVFKKIVLQIKKLAVKLVIAMDGSSAKAASMLKAFEANKDFVPTAKELPEEVATKLIARVGGINVLNSAWGDKGILTAQGNLEAVRTFTESVTGDLETLHKVADAEADGSDAAKLLAALKSGSFKSFKYQVAQAVAKGDKAGLAKIEVGGTAKALKLTNDQLAELNIPEGVVSGSVQFYPTFPKGNKLHGVVFYSVDVGEDASAAAIVGAIKYSNGTVTALSESDIAKAAKSATVLARDVIVAKLRGFETASKDLKAYSDARMKDVDKAMKDIDTIAKKSDGLAVFNRLAGSELNMSRMFIAGNHISSVLAGASTTRAVLGGIAAHINMYAKPGK